MTRGSVRQQPGDRGPRLGRAPELVPQLPPKRDRLLAGSVSKTSNTVAV